MQSTKPLQLQCFGKHLKAYALITKFATGNVDSIERIYVVIVIMEDDPSYLYMNIK